MEVNGYIERREKEKVELRPLGAGRVMVYTAHYDPKTGDRLPDQATDLNIAGLETDRASVVTQIDQLTAALADLDALIADLKAANESFGKQ